MYFDRREAGIVFFTITNLFYTYLFLFLNYFFIRSYFIYLHLFISLKSLYSLYY